MTAKICRRINLKYVNDAEYPKRSVGCLVLSKDRKIVLQLRDDNAPTFPGHLATFGGGIEKDETPEEALIRELKEELGAAVLPRDIVALGAITEPETDHHHLVYVYFWHDFYGSITGCFEGQAKYFNDPVMPQQHPKVMNDVIWLIEECKRRGLLK